MHRRVTYDISDCRGQPGPLRVIQKDAFVLLLLLLQDPDLFLEVLELEMSILVLLTA